MNVLVKFEKQNLSETSSEISGIAAGDRQVSAAVFTITGRPFESTLATGCEKKTRLLPVLPVNLKFSAPVFLFTERKPEKAKSKSAKILAKFYIKIVVFFSIYYLLFVSICVRLPLRRNNNVLYWIYSAIILGKIYRACVRRYNFALINI